MLVALWLFFWASLSNGTDTGHNGFDCSTNPTVSSCGWELPAGGTSLTISDDGYAQVDLPFSFPFYGDYYGTSFMHSNGVVSFPYNNATNPTHHFCCNGYDLEAAINNGTYATRYPQFHHFIAVLWTDLISLNKDIDGDGIFDNGYYTWVEDAEDGSQYQHYLWRNLSEFYNTNNNNTVGLSLKDNGGITINHGEVNITNHSVNVGIYGDPSSDEYEQIYYGYGKNSTWSDTYQQYSGIPSYDITALCNANPLFNASCPGYAEAYAELLYNQACAADPLYDSGCTGYQEAYYDQQCTAEPLYDSGCTGYSEAIQSCNDNPLSNQLCPDYTITVTQCEINDLFYTYCPNYQSDLTQCDIDSQSNLLCPNYTEEEEIIETIPDEEFEISITGDSVVDDIISVSIPVIEEPIIEEPIIEEEIEEEFIEEPIIEEEFIEEPIIEDEVIEDEVIEDEVVAEEKKEKSKKEKIRDLMIKKAKSLADDMGKAATAEQQAMIQQQVMAVMAYVYGFDQYKITMNGGYYPDNSWYRPSVYPDNNFGARNGLAQELLWNDMVDMQYK